MRRGTLQRLAAMAALMGCQSAMASDSVRYTYDTLGRLIVMERRASSGQGVLDAYLFDPASNRARVQSSGPFRGDTLSWHDFLQAGQTLLSSDARFRLTLQFDGDVALYDSQGEQIWHTGTSGRGGNWLVVQNDGNLVLYNSAQQPIWTTATEGQFESHLVVQTDGNVVLYRADGQYTWSSGTCCH
jgi:hypothetical protein